ncbi:MAG: sulfurtransferase [Chloroflexota bacterium]
MDAPIVVNTEWLGEHINDPNVVVVDVRPPPLYNRGHVPGAVNLPLFLLSNPTGGVAQPDHVAARLGAAGIQLSSHVVAYDDGASTTASELFWLLSYCRHPRASVLDGGATKWASEGRLWNSHSSLVTPVLYEAAEPDFDVFADLDDVLAALDSSNAVILDTRGRAEFMGLQRTARRDGHIPGAVHIDWLDNLSTDQEYVCLVPDDRLRHMYAAAGVTPDKKVYVHCQIGHRAAESFMVLKKLGYPSVAVYVDGWQEWGNRADTPVQSA